MASKQNFLGLIDPGREIRRPPLVGMQFLHEGAVSAADLLRARPGLKAKDLIGLLFRHFAAERRAAAVPRCRIVLRVFTPAGLAGDQDKPSIDCGCRRRFRRSDRSAWQDRAHRARRLDAGRRERGRASRRCRGRVPFPETPCARARPGPDSFCVRPVRIAGHGTCQPSKPRPKTPTGIATQICPRKRRKAARSNAATPPIERMRRAACFGSALEKALTAHSSRTRTTTPRRKGMAISAARSA